MHFSTTDYHQCCNCRNARATAFLPLKWVKLGTNLRRTKCYYYYYYYYYYCYYYYYYYCLKTMEKKRGHF